MGFNKNYQTIFQLIVVFLALFIFIILLKQSSSNSNSFLYQNSANDLLPGSIQGEVLLIYVYSRTHSKAYGNLKYFVDHAVRENDGVDYFFILQNVDNKTINETDMPLLPRGNARYIQHENICFDFGTVGWFFDTYTVGNPWGRTRRKTGATVYQGRKIDITRYKYFILMNSSVRGPFLPPYYLKFVSDYKEEFNTSFHWYYIFTKRINEKVKLVGCTISCIPRPHVQSYLLVTDFVGLKILLKPGGHSGSRSEGIFGCFPAKDDYSMFSEVPTSTRILDRGYMIDCLLTKYQQVDFTLPHNQKCNRFENPYLEKNFEGTPLEPYEVVFLKYKDTLDTQFNKRKGELYEKWMEDATKSNRTEGIIASL